MTKSFAAESIISSENQKNFLTTNPSDFTLKHFHGERIFMQLMPEKTLCEYENNGW